VTSFHGVFNGNNAFLDLNGDGLVNRDDSQEAINRIVQKVREDYAPYDLQIIVGDQDYWADTMKYDTRGHVTVMISGGDDVVRSQGMAGWAGIIDAGNERNDYAFVFGGTIANVTSSIEGFINSIARTISHEMGHTFGLEHVVATSSNDASQHYLMNSRTSSGNDWRDFTRDFNFQNITYTTVTNVQQNSHEILSVVLGPAKHAWAAVLQPGILTIHSGEDYGVSFSVSPSSTGGGDWDVRDHRLGITHHLDPSNSPDINSLNPFETAISLIYMEGGDFTDYLNVFAGINVTVWAEGRGGRDYLYGGDATDFLIGGEENDYLFGRGGMDFLSGNSGDDYLDGGRDGFADYLSGGTGTDTFVDHKQWVLMRDFMFGFWGSEDNKTDYDPREDRLIPKYPWS
jgi:hypothetical protein